VCAGGVVRRFCHNLWRSEGSCPKEVVFLTGYWRMRRNIEVEELWDGPPEVTRGRT